MFKKFREKLSLKGRSGSVGEKIKNSSIFNKLREKTENKFQGFFEKTKTAGKAAFRVGMATIAISQISPNSGNDLSHVCVSDSDEAVAEFVEKLDSKQFTTIPADFLATSQKADDFDNSAKDYAQEKPDLKKITTIPADLLVASQKADDLADTKNYAQEKQDFIPITSADKKGPIDWLMREYGLTFGVATKYYNKNLIVGEDGSSVYPNYRNFSVGKSYKLFFAEGEAEGYRSGIPQDIADVPVVNVPVANVPIEDVPVEDSLEQDITKVSFEDKVLSNPILGEILLRYANTKKYMTEGNPDDRGVILKVVSAFELFQKRWKKINKKRVDITSNPDVEKKLDSQFTETFGGKLDGNDYIMMVASLESSAREILKGRVVDNNSGIDGAREAFKKYTETGDESYMETYQENIDSIVKQAVGPDGDSGNYRFVYGAVIQEGKSLGFAIEDKPYGCEINDGKNTYTLNKDPNKVRKMIEEIVKNGISQNMSNGQIEAELAKREIRFNNSIMRVLTKARPMRANQILVDRYGDKLSLDERAKLVSLSHNRGVGGLLKLVKLYLNQNEPLDEFIESTSASDYYSRSNGILALSALSKKENSNSQTEEIEKELAYKFQGNLIEPEIKAFALVVNKMPELNIDILIDEYLTLHQDIFVGEFLEQTGIELSANLKMEIDEIKNPKPSVATTTSEEVKIANTQTGELQKEDGNSTIAVGSMVEKTENKSKKTEIGVGVGIATFAATSLANGHNKHQVIGNAEKSLREKFAEIEIKKLTSSNEDSQKIKKDGLTTKSRNITEYNALNKAIELAVGKNKEKDLRQFLQNNAIHFTDNESVLERVNRIISDQNQKIFRLARVQIDLEKERDSLADESKKFRRGMLKSREIADKYRESLTLKKIQENEISRNKDEISKMQSNIKIMEIVIPKAQSILESGTSDDYNYAVAA